MAYQRIQMLSSQFGSMSYRALLDHAIQRDILAGRMQYQLCAARYSLCEQYMNAASEIGARIQEVQVAETRVTLAERLPTTLRCG